MRLAREHFAFQAKGLDDSATASQTRQTKETDLLLTSYISSTVTDLLHLSPCKHIYHMMLSLYVKLFLPQHKPSSNYSLITYPSLKKLDYANSQADTCDLPRQTHIHPGWVFNPAWTNPIWHTRQAHSYYAADSAQKLPRHALYSCGIILSLLVLGGWATASKDAGGAPIYQCTMPSSDNKTCEPEKFTYLCNLVFENTTSPFRVSLWCAQNKTTP